MPKGKSTCKLLKDIRQQIADANGYLLNVNTLNSAVFFLVRNFYMLRCLFGALYVDMRCFGVSWVFSK